MTDTTPTQPAKAVSSPAIARLLAAVRRGFRAYVWADGASMAALALGAAFWATLAIDWTLEPPPWLRGALLVVVAVALAWLVYRFILQRAFVPLPDRQIALIVERRYPMFEDSLITTVELDGARPRNEPCDRQMLASTRAAAVGAVPRVRLGEVFNTRPLARRIAVAGLLVASVVAFGAAASDVFGVWIRRSLLLSSERWPRNTRLVAEGFNSGRGVKVALGSDFDLVVKADATIGHVAPRTVEVQYLDGSGRREPMSREGEAVAGLDPTQKFTYTFKSLLSSVEFYVIGGDERLGPLKIEAVESPTIGRMKLSCRYPEYMRRAPRDMPVSGLLQLPFGTEVSIHCEANKDLVRAQIDEPAEQGPPITHTIELAASRSFETAPRSFRFDIPRLESDKTLLFTLWDTDGVRSREPVRLTLSAIADEPPQVEAQFRGIGRAITPSAKLPADGVITDDYGVAKAWYEFQIDDQKAALRPIAIESAGGGEVALRDTFPAVDLSLAPKQKLRVEIHAADTFNLAMGPNQGMSQRYVLDVVTPDELVALLEARELALRRRFETIIEELTATRESVSRLSFEIQSTPAADEKAPGEEAPKPLSPEEQLDRRRTVVERALQNTQRSAQETLEVGSAFLEIHDELVNNDIDSEERKTRLKEGIAEPLAKIGGESEAALIEKIKFLQSVSTDSTQGPLAKAEVVTLADQVLVEMEQVRGRMIQLETYNEILDLLRDIIDTQRDVGRRTKEIQKQKLRKLLEKE